MTSPTEKYTYKTFCSEEDQEFVSTVLEFPSLSWLADSASDAEAGLRKLVAEVIGDIGQSGERVPEPLP